MNNPITKSLNNFIRNTPVVRTKNHKTNSTEFSYLMKEFKSEKKAQS